MYLTMNRFRVRPGQEAAFEAMWKTRDSHLKSVPGFVSFHLMRGEEVDGATLYASHTLWTDRDAFLAWTKSEAFRQAHKGCEIVGRHVRGPSRSGMLRQRAGDRGGVTPRSDPLAAARH
jgi:heme-degrading monooxygenase HmoA